MVIIKYITKQPIIAISQVKYSEILFISNVPGNATNCVTNNAISKSDELNPNVKP